MKCPKCGYHSFEFLDECKKCKADLTAFKATHKIAAVILPATAPPAAATPAPATTTESLATNSQDDFLTSSPAIISNAGGAFDDPSALDAFSFDEQPATETEGWDFSTAETPKSNAPEHEKKELPDLFSH